MARAWCSRHQCPRIASRFSKLRNEAERPVQPLFDLVLIDESSQVDMTAGVGPLALLKERSLASSGGPRSELGGVIFGRSWRPFVTSGFPLTW